MCVIGWVCWSIRDFPYDTWRLSVVDVFSVGSHKDFPGCLILEMVLLTYSIPSP
jgi:hypothetical protein